MCTLFDEIAKENENIKVLKINVDEEQKLAIENNVMNVPTLIVIKDGKEIKRSIGLIDKKEIEKLIN